MGNLTLRGKIDLDWAAKSIPALKKRLAEYRAKGVIPNQQIALATQGLDTANDDMKMAAMIATFFKTREVA